MNVRVLTERDYERMPWLNGGGYATEFAIKNVDPALRRPDDTFVWRLSDADIDRSGPFSNYAGIERRFMLFEGNGVVLDFGEHGVRRVDELYRFVPFDGGWNTHCELIDGPARAFNLQFARRYADAREHVIDSGGAAYEKTFPAEDCKDAATRLLFILNGEASVRVGDGADIALPTRATLIVEQDTGAPQALTLSGRDFRAVLVDVVEKAA